MNGKKMIKSKKKNTVRHVYKNIQKFFSSMKKEFLALDKTFRFLICMWSIILVLVLLLFIGSQINNKVLSKYHSLEEQMTIGAKEYVQKEGIYPSSSAPLRLSLEVLRENNSVYEEKMDDTCTGYSKIVYSDTTEDYEIDSYITCKSYTTKAYKDNK